MIKFLIKNPGFWLIFPVIFTALFAGILSPYSIDDRFEPYCPPGKGHLLGTNDLGNDIFTELLLGSRISLQVGFTTALVSTFLGLMIGLFAGYYGGWKEEGLMGLTDIFLMIPRIPLLIVVSAFLQPGTWTIAFLVGVLWWPSTARVVRSKTLQIKEATFIKSAEGLGFPRLQILWQEILPNLISVLSAKLMITFASAMLVEASVSFLGMGDPLVKSWGMMLHTAFNKGGLINNMWWWYLPPGACITLVVVGVMFFGIALEKPIPFKRTMDSIK
jgi:peptide/nickel transport system permease protein